MAVEKQRRMLKRKPEIVVATPGRVWELISCGEDHISDLSAVRFLAIDEADRLTEVNHFPELHALLEKLNADAEDMKRRQNFVFSATLTLVHEMPTRIKKRMSKGKRDGNTKSTPEAKLHQLMSTIGVTDPKVVDVTRKTAVAETLSETRIECLAEEKDLYLFYFLQRHPGRTAVFCNSIGCVQRLATLFGLLNCRPLPLHANMQQRQRLKNLDRFRDDPQGLLVATDVAARGLDIPNIDHVLHYQMPRTSEGYVHRSGRTARASRPGLTVLLVEPKERDSYRRMLKTLGKDKDVPLFPIDTDLMPAVKERVFLARDIDNIELKTRKRRTKDSWMEKAAEEMDIVLDEDERSSDEEDSQVTAAVEHERTRKRKSLNALLKRKLIQPKVLKKSQAISSALLVANGNGSATEQPSDSEKEEIREAEKTAGSNGSVEKQKKKHGSLRPSKAERRRMKRKKAEEEDTTKQPSDIKKKKIREVEKIADSNGSAEKQKKKRKRRRKKSGGEAAEK